MNPRKDTSTSFTKFPTDILQQIREIYEEQFPQIKGKLAFTGLIYPEEICFSAAMKQEGRLAYAQFQISADVDSQGKIDHFKVIQNCVDAAATFLAEHLENAAEEKEPMDYPLGWTEFQFEKDTLFFQFSSENPEIEQMANELLGETEDALVQEKKKLH